MLQSILIIVIGIAVGWACGRLMEPTVHATRATLAVGAFGALAAIAVARRAGLDGMNLPAQAIVVALVGSLLATFVVGVVRQWRTPGPWVTERERLGAAISTSGRTAAAEASLARTATRSHPLLLLHSSRALRCWPTEGEPWSQRHGQPERLDWMVEIDGGDTYVGPSSGALSTRSEVEAGVRAWWDGVELAAAAARGMREPPRPNAL